MRPDLPGGTVTFLFTDIEGSTKLLHRLGEASYAQALAEHRRLLRAAFAAHDGAEVDTQGDAFFVAFPTADGALSAAVEGLEALRATPITVRIGVHTGTPLLTDEGYVGHDVHRAARIAASGSGGQILVSSSTAAVLETNAFPLRDLGEHRFKDLAEPERVYQVGDDNFPPLRSLSASNLPVPTTPFLGRRIELARVTELLAEPTLRMLTLTGPGGTGKTRLAIQAAAEASEGFPGGLWWVPLAPLGDPALVPSEIASTLGAEERSDASLAETISARTGGRRTLVVLDNAEHLLPQVADEIAPLTRNGAGTTLLVTSRERLHLEAEREVPVPSMDAEDAEAFLLSRAEALGIHLEPSSTLRELAERLDRLPLAMQLAVSRLRLFSLDQLLDRLSRALDLPGERDADPRQRTLRATIQWSYDLLDEDERMLLRRMSVFAAGGTLDAVEAICGSDIEVLLSLIDKSLVRRRDDAPEPRFWMLETIRAFAAERLEEAGETGRSREAHARWIAKWALAEDAQIHEAVDRGPSLQRFDHELDDVRAALAFARERSDRDLVAAIAGRLRMQWHLRGYYREGREWLEAAYAEPGADPTDRIRVVDGLASVAYRQGDYDRSLAVAEAALPLARETGSDVEWLSALTNLAHASSALGRIDEATGWYDEAIVVARRTGDPARIASAIVNRGDMATIAGRYDEASAFLEEGLDYSRHHGVMGAAAVATINLATISFLLERPDEAERYAREAARITEMTDLDTIALLVLAGTRQRRGDHVGAARLLGASDGIRERSGYVFEPGERAADATIRAEVGPWLEIPEGRAAYGEGHALEPDAARELIEP